MAELFLFNPENDLALAAGTANFTPPRGAAMLRDAGCSLPAWWAAEGDGVIGVTADEAERLRREFGIIIRREGLPDDIGRPWGWSEYARRIFRRAGLRNLPGDDELSRIRELSHRRTAQKVLQAMGIDDVEECRSVAEVERAVGGGERMIKSPWSCSGRGVMSTRGRSREEIRRHAAGIIRRQGSVMIEPLLQRYVDFAALYEATDEGVVFVGWSMFNTSDAGAYTGNVVAPQEKIREKLSELIAIDEIEDAAAEISRHLTEIIGEDYRGPLGADMMICGEGRRLRPVIEINMRRTMGRAALDICRKLGVEGTLAYAPSTEGEETVISRSATGQGFVLKTVGEAS